MLIVLAVPKSIRFPFEYMQKRTGGLIVSDINLQFKDNTEKRHINCGLEYETSNDLLIDLSFEAKEDLDETVIFSFNLETNDFIKVGYLGFRDHIKMSAGEKLKKTFSFDLNRLHRGDYKMVFAIGTMGGPQLEGINNLFYMTIKRAIPDNKSNLNWNGMQRNLKGGYLLSMSMD